MTDTALYLDTTDKVRENIDRAAGILGEYRSLTGSPVLEAVGLHDSAVNTSDALADLLADLRQWAVAVGVDFQAELDRAESNATAELAGDMR